MERPNYVEDRHLEYLDQLRDSGVTNMYGASPCLQAAFGVSREHARNIFGYWMQTFAERHPKEAAER